MASYSRKDQNNQAMLSSFNEGKDPATELQTILALFTFKPFTTTDKSIVSFFREREREL